MTTAINALLLHLGLLVCGQAIQPPPATTLESLMTRIALGEGRLVYAAFEAVPEVADTAEKREKAFEGLADYLGEARRYCVVGDYYPPENHTRQRSFSYAELASRAIRKLGEPGRRGLVDGLTSKPLPVALQAALTLCAIEADAIGAKGRPESKDYPPLDAGSRKALELFLQQHGSSFSVHILTRFYNAGLPAAAGYIHAILKTTADSSEKSRAVLYLGSYGYAPALDDLLEIFKDTSNASLRSTVREKLQYFSDSERVTKALTEIMGNAKDEGLRRECRTALELVALKAEWRRSYGTSKDQ